MVPGRADPITVQVSIDPQQPLPCSTVTFNATILGNESIEEVRLLVQECRADMCYVLGSNVSMEKTTNDTYEARCTLTHSDASQMKYHLGIFSNGTWYASDITFVQLASNPSGKPSQGVDSPSTPGFEFFVCALAVILTGVLYSRRRH
jgi:hypothetical protein